jgi:acyl carrier protein
MQFENTLTIVQNICRKVFNDSSLIITDQTSAIDIANWDSLNHVVLIMEVEKVFKIKFALGELQDLKNVGSLVEIIDKKVN